VKFSDDAKLSNAVEQGMSRGRGATWLWVSKRSVPCCDRSTEVYSLELVIGMNAQSGRFAGDSGWVDVETCGQGGNEH
jgi:hypothetical protein